MLGGCELGAAGLGNVSSCFIARELSSLATGHGAGSTGSSLGYGPFGSVALANRSTGKIWGFHGGDYAEWGLLGCYAAWLL
jgi:hypothetical protein